MKKGICKIACGGLHNAAVTVDGELYTWGANDEGALGRATGHKPGDEREELPGRVDFESAFKGGTRVKRCSLPSTATHPFHCSLRNGYPGA
jgi:alpha-tubulin suppressor-like RCC1 family protein